MYPYNDDFYYEEDDFYYEEDEFMYRQRPPVAPPFGLPGGGGFFPPGGGPGGPGGPGGFPGGPGGPGGPAGRPPSGPPPAFTPSQSQSQSLGGPSVQFIDPGAISGCRFRFVYIWLDNGTSFWAYLTFVGRRSVAGFRWQRRRWVYFGIDTRRIDSFICY